MAALTLQERADIVADIQRTSECTSTITKTQLRAVIDALDDWWEATGAIAANSSIPTPQRGAMTVRQKAYIFKVILDKKYRGV